MFHYDGSGGISSTNLLAFAARSGIAGGGYWAIEETGILDMLPGFKTLSGSSSAIYQAAAAGAAQGLGREVARAVGLLGESSLLLTGQLMPYVDEVLYNTLLNFGMDEAGLLEKIVETTESVMPGELTVAGAMGITNETGSLLRQYLSNMVVNSSNPSEHYLNYLLFPATSLQRGVGG